MDDLFFVFIIWFQVAVIAVTGTILLSRLSRAVGVINKQSRLIKQMAKPLLWQTGAIPQDPNVLIIGLWECSASRNGLLPSFSWRVCRVIDNTEKDDPPCEAVDKECEIIERPVVWAILDERIMNTSDWQKELNKIYGWE